MIIGLLRFAFDRQLSDKLRRKTCSQLLKLTWTAVIDVDIRTACNMLASGINRHSFSIHIPRTRYGSAWLFFAVMYSRLCMSVHLLLLTYCCFVASSDYFLFGASVCR